MRKYATDTVQIGMSYRLNVKYYQVHYYNKYQRLVVSITTNPIINCREPLKPPTLLYIRVEHTIGATGEYLYLQTYARQVDTYRSHGELKFILD